MAGGAISALIASKLGALTAPVPQWTLAFNITALTAFAFARPFADAAPAAAPLPLAELMPLDWCSAALTGVSQIFVVNNPIAGAIILAGIAAYSPGAALATLFGSVVGVLTAVAMGADGNAIKDGLWGFNPALTALSVSIFFVPLGAPYAALACGGAIATALATIGFNKIVGNAIESPSLTLPFCLVASGCFLLGGRFPGLVHARAPHSPEMNLNAFRAAART
jgi:urea transporter